MQERVKWMQRDCRAQEKTEGVQVRQRGFRGVEGEAGYWVGVRSVGKVVE